MNTHSKHVLKPIVIAVALALPGTAAFAESFDQVVKTRADQNVDEQFGRDSVYAFSRDAKPMTPAETTGSRDTNLFTKAKDYAANTWHKTTDFIGDRFHHDGDGASSANMMSNEPQSFGRAGGYVAADRVNVLNSDAPYRANATPTDDGRAEKAPLNSSYNNSSYQSSPSASNDMSTSSSQEIQSASSAVIANPNWSDSNASSDSTAVIAPATTDDSAKLESSDSTDLQSSLQSSDDEQPMAASDGTQPAISKDSGSDQSLAVTDEDDDSLAMNDDEEEADAIVYTDPDDGSTHLLILE